MAALLLWRISVASAGDAVVPVTVGVVAAATGLGVTLTLATLRADRQRAHLLLANARARQLEQTRQLLREVARAPDPSAALAAVVRSSGAHAASMYVIEGEVLTPVASHGVSGRPATLVVGASPADHLPGARLPVAEHLTTGTIEVVVVIDAGDESRVAAVESTLAESAPALLSQVLLEQERGIADRLAQLERLRAEVVRTVAHDVRSPLGVIRGYAELLATGDAGQVAVACDAIIRSSDRIEHLATSLLSSARAEQAELQRVAVDLAALAHEVAGELRVTNPGRRIDIAGRDDVVALGDPDAQWQVVTNLLTNALKYSPATAAVEVEVARADAFAVVTVLDRGPGIVPADRARLFQPFARVDRNGAGGPGGPGGTGLGLYICRQLVERQGGEIRVAGRAGGGTAFAYTVPIAPAG